MPVDNNFQHSKYSRADPGDRVAYLEFEPGAPYESAAWQDALSHAGFSTRQSWRSPSVVHQRLSLFRPVWVRSAG